ncbi:MAG: hypothetical protein COX19_03185 [Desulfobacterales bacterium CG23_combo_of_CG06-09_8_20_14_all_51_8]|nr:MAG: hypothetical protein COX19_03185 [Desulfobacterales bacterium CG23_combo_of_CG06-09_8_20_14_all_51_8]
MDKRKFLKVVKIVGFSRRLFFELAGRQVFVNIKIEPPGAACLIKFYLIIEKNLSAGQSSVRKCVRPEKSKNSCLFRWCGI